MSRKLYLLCNLYFDKFICYGIYSNKIKLVNDYKKISMDEKWESLEHISVLEFEENALAGKLDLKFQNASNLNGFNRKLPIHFGFSLKRNAMARAKIL